MRTIRMEGASLEGLRPRRDTRDDLRRHWERLLNRARFLDEHERTFLELVVEQGGRIGRLARLSRQSPAALSRRVRDIARRLTACELQAVLEHPEAFSAFEKACIREHLVRKHPLARAAVELGTTVYTLRKTLAAARTKARRLCAHEDV